VLDLTPYLEQESVRIRFRFRSNPEVVQAGSYVDDVHVYGRTHAYHPPRGEADPGPEPAVDGP
jgi:hypothetical protein